MFETFRKLRALLNPREQRQALLLLGMMLVLGVVEMAGVASIFPLIAVLSDPSLVDSNPWLKLTYDTLGFTSLNAFFIFLSAAVFGVVVLRTLFTAFTSYGLLHYAQMRSHRLSVTLLGSYLRRPYAFFLNRHSADMSKSVLSEVDLVINGSLVPALQLVSQTIIASFIVAALVFVEPVVAFIAVASVVGAYGLGYYLVRDRLRRKGQQRNAANQARFGIAQEVLSGVKEVKVGGLERGYLRRFNGASFRFAKLRTQFNLIREIPRHLLELVAVGGILIVILTLLFRSDGNITSTLPVLAVFAFAGLRLLPAVQVLYQAVVALRFEGPALDRLHEDLFEADHAIDLEPVAPLGLERHIVLDHVSFAYPEANQTALRDVSLTIPARSTIGFVGPSGAGKSTLIDIILGLLEPHQGELRVDGVIINRANVRAWHRTVGYVPQQIFLSDESIASNIALGLPPEAIDMDAVHRAAKQANLHDFIVSDLPRGYQTEVGDRGIRLSGGQRQRIGIARALYHNPSVLVLDEATSALDQETERQVMAEVARLAQSITVVMIAHRLSTLENCDEIIRIERGAVTDRGKFADFAMPFPKAN
jgi:ABC-type bacteriocin/lantibiotic exporters, contain an N-terminal double-glycine peptidase domain